MENSTPLLSDKSVSREKINPTENKKMLTSESETTETLNNFFSNIVKKLDIPKYNSNSSVTENIKDPVFKAILKYKNHPSILAIQKYRKNKTFHFEEVNIGEVEKEKLHKNRYSHWNYQGKYCNAVFTMRKQCN